jgi:TRAP-type C4-dicarboxylate transport system permease small subunit
MNNYVKPSSGEADVFHSPLACRLLSQLVYWVTTAAMALSAVGVMVALVLISYGVLARYVLGQPSLWIDDLVTFILVGIVMLGAAATLREGRHLGVDLITEHLKGRHQRWSEIWSMFAVLLVALYLVIDGWQTAMFSKRLGMTTLGYVEMPLFWLQLLIPLGGIMLLLVCLDSLLRLFCGGNAYTDLSQEEED